MSGNKQLKIGAILSYVAIFINVATGLIYTPWMVDKIGQSQYGLFTLANSLITLFLVDFGLSAATSRFVSKYRAEGDEQKVNDFLGAIYKIYLLIDFVILAVFTVLYFFLDAIYVKLTPAELEQFKVVYIIAAAFSVFNFPFVTFNGILNSYERFIPLKLADIFHKVVMVAMMIVALSLGYGLYALVTLNAVAGILTILFKFIVLKRSTPVRVNWKYGDRALYKEIFGFSVWMAIATVAQRLIFNITPSILGMVASSAAIAVFGVVTTIEGYTYTFTSAINGMFMPKISRIYNSDNANEKIMPLMISVGKFQYALNGLIVAGFAVVGKMFIKLWMGPAYIDAYIGILLVIIPGLFYNSLQIANTTMMVQNKVNYQAYITIIIGVVNVILSFILSAAFGVVGACVSIFVAYMLRAVLTNIVVYKKLNMNIPLFARECYLKMSIPLLLTVIVGIGINCLPMADSWWALVLKGGAVCILYALLILLIGLNKSERSHIIAFIKKGIEK